MWKKPAAPCAARGVVFNEEMEFGCMVETPSAALLAGDILAAGCRFLVAGHQRPGAVHLRRRPAGWPLLRLFQRPQPGGAPAGGHGPRGGGRTGAPVCICGVHAGSPNQVVRYARQGVRCFSTEAASLLQVKARLLEEDLTAPETD